MRIVRCAKNGCSNASRADGDETWNLGIVPSGPRTTPERRPRGARALRQPHASSTGSDR